MSYVRKFLPPRLRTASHFLRRLSVETDCADVHHALTTRSKILCCYMWWAARRPSPSPYSRRDPSAAFANDARTHGAMAPGYPLCGLLRRPHCNGADRAALKLARLGLAVKIMLGGITGWEDEGYSFAAR
jgi:hypothetical protein